MVQPRMHSKIIPNGPTWALYTPPPHKYSRRLYTHREMDARYKTVHMQTAPAVGYSRVPMRPRSLFVHRGRGSAARSTRAPSTTRSQPSRTCHSPWAWPRESSATASSVENSSMSNLAIKFMNAADLARTVGNLLENHPAAPAVALNAHEQHLIDKILARRVEGVQLLCRRRLGHGAEAGRHDQRAAAPPWAPHRRQSARPRRRL